MKIDRTTWYLYKQQDASPISPLRLDGLAQMFFKYRKIMNTFEVGSADLSARDIFNNFNWLNNSNNRRQMREILDEGLIYASAEYEISYYNQDIEVNDVHVNCTNLTEVLINGVDPEFEDDGDAFDDALREEAYENIEYEIESQNFNIDEDNIEFYPAVTPAEDILIGQAINREISLDNNSLNNFLDELVYNIEGTNENLDNIAVNFMLDRLAGHLNGLYENAHKEPLKELPEVE